MSPVFRKEQRRLNAEERQMVNHVKQLAEDLHDVVDMLPASRARDMARVKLEECVMWTVKAVSDAL
jgi:hypothetical protein